MTSPPSPDFPKVEGTFVFEQLHQTIAQILPQLSAAELTQLRQTLDREQSRRHRECTYQVYPKKNSNGRDYAYVRNRNRSVEKSLGPTPFRPHHYYRITDRRTQVTATLYCDSILVSPTFNPHTDKDGLIDLQFLTTFPPAPNHWEQNGWQRYRLSAAWQTFNTFDITPVSCSISHPPHRIHETLPVPQSPLAALLLTPAQWQRLQRQWQTWIAISQVSVDGRWSRLTDATRETLLSGNHQPILSYTALSSLLLLWLPAHNLVQLWHQMSLDAIAQGESRQREEQGRQLFFRSEQMNTESNRGFLEELLN
jgi:hypothetical protein